MINFVEPSVTLVTEENLEKRVEAAFRICYKSEGRMTLDSEKEFLPRLIYTDRQNKHWSPLEHARIGMYFTPEMRELFTTYIEFRTVKSRVGYWPLVLPELNDADSGESGVIVRGNFRVWMEFLVWDGWKSLSLLEKTVTKEFRNNFGDGVGAVSFSYEHMLAGIQEILHNEFPSVFKSIAERFLPTGSPYPSATDPKVLGVESRIGVLRIRDYMTFHIVTTRDILQELARHRSLSFSVESTRYCNYGKRGMTFTIPRPYEWTNLIDDWSTAVDFYERESKNSGFRPTKEQIKLLQYIRTCLNAEKDYECMLEVDAVPQEARMVLPGALKTELYMTGTKIQWEAFLRLRDDGAAHPMIRILAEKIKKHIGELK